MNYIRIYVFPTLQIIITKMFPFDLAKESDLFDPLGQDVPVNSTSPFYQHCLTSFYDQESPQENSTNCSLQQALCYLEHMLDICDTPLKDIMHVVESNPVFNGVNFQLLRRKVIKQKNRLKRERAKNRKNFIRERVVPVFVSKEEEKEEEQFKKQRNRLSAQLSRDRKKEQVKALEALNQKLQEECLQQKQENELLRRQISEKDSKQTPTIKGPFARMLFFLGIFFLLAIIKDLLNPSESTTTIAKIQAHTSSLLEKPVATLAPFPDHQQALKDIEAGLMESVGDKSIVAKLKEGLSQRLIKWLPIPEAKGQLKEKSDMLAQSVRQRTKNDLPF